MRILVINPVGHPTWDLQDKKLYEGYSSPETEINVLSLPEGPASVETPEAHAEVIPLVIKMAQEHHNNYDALIVNCCLDPAVDLLKGLIKEPVIGPCEASLHLASLLGTKPAVITVGKEGIWMIEKRVNEIMPNGKVMVSRIPIGVLDIDKDRNKAAELLIKEARKMLSEKMADIFVLGCTGLSGLADEVMKAVGAPVIDPAGAAVKLAEAAVKLHLYNALYLKEGGRDA